VVVLGELTPWEEKKEQQEGRWDETKQTLWKGRTGSAPRGYSGQAALRRSNVTDLINTLPDNSSVHTVQLAAMDEAVFSMSSAPSSGGTTGLCNPFLSNGLVNTLPCRRWCHTTVDSNHVTCFL
jgi:hypothetical protein